MPYWHGLRCLPEMTAIIITGSFHFFQEGGPNSINLYEMTVQIISHSECNSTYVIFGGITDRMICAGDPNAEKGACWVIIIINYFGVVCWILG